MLTSILQFFWATFSSNSDSQATTTKQQQQQQPVDKNDRLFWHAFNQCCLFSLIFFLTFKAPFLIFSHRFPSSHYYDYPRLPPRLSERLLGVASLFPIRLPTYQRPRSHESFCSYWAPSLLRASYFTLASPTSISLTSKILAPEKPLLLSSEKLDHDHYPAREESLKLNQFRSAPDSWPSLPITNEGVLS